jgi:hypothetical protein
MMLTWREQALQSGIFMKHLENKGNTLFHSMEHTNTSGVYRLLFEETNTEQVDTLIATMSNMQHQKSGKSTYLTV